MSSGKDAEMLLKKAMSRPGVGEVMELHLQFKKVIDQVKPYTYYGSKNHPKFVADTNSR